MTKLRYPLVNVKSLSILFVVIIFIATVMCVIIWQNGWHQKVISASDFPFEVLGDYQTPITRVEIPNWDFQGDDSLQNNWNDSTWVLLVLGQSQAANHAQKMYQKIHPQIWNFYLAGTMRIDTLNQIETAHVSNPKMVMAQDPLKGASGNFGSVWIPLAQRAIDSLDIISRAILVPLAQGGTLARDWLPGEALFENTRRSIAELQSKNIQIDQVIWHQGESDFVAKTDLDIYYQQVRSIMVELNLQLPEVPIYLAISTYINTEEALISKTPGVSLPLQKTQLRLINDLPFLHKGVVSDSLVDINLNQLPELNVLRFDGIHFSEIGQDILVNQWWSTLWN